MHRKLGGFIFLALLAAGLAGCTPEGRQQYGRAGEQGGEAAQQTGRAVKTDAEGTADRASRWSFEDVELDPQKFGRAFRNVNMTARVRSMLMAAEDIEFDNLNVDTQGNTVYLRGSTTSASEKQRAQAMATAFAGPKWVVVNELSVGAGSNVDRRGDGTPEDDNDRNRRGRGPG